MYKICKHSKFKDSLIKYFEDNNIEYVVKGCMGKCSTCGKKPFVKFKGEFIKSETTKGLFEKIKQQ